MFYLFIFFLLVVVTFAVSLTAIDWKEKSRLRNGLSYVE